MLAISRTVGQKLIIGEDITIVVLAVQGDKVRLGLDAPKSVAIFREELLRAHKEPPEDRPPAA